MKLKINYYTYFLLISAILCGVFKECLILFSIVLIHELGHIIMIKYFHYKIKEIEILPFGGITKIEKDLNSAINKEIIISISGIMMQLVLFIILSFLKNHNLINLNIYYLFLKYNFSILIFNLLPIIPLDGSIFIKSIFEKFFSFYYSQIMIIILSVLFLGIFFYLNYYFSLNNYLIGIFLLYKIYDYIINLKYLKNRFLLERYLHNYQYKDIKLIDKLNLMQKERKHFFKVNQRLIEEKEILKSYFNS